MKDPSTKTLRMVAAACVLYFSVVQSYNFMSHSARMAVQLSNPSIMMKARLRTGETIMIDDFREAYFWLRDNTPEDARVMSWWDYGYEGLGWGGGVATPGLDFTTSQRR